MEKSELEQNVAQSNKIVDRMSRNVEQLQWRIKNNYEVPVEKLTTTQQTLPSPELIIHGETSPSVFSEEPQPQLRYPDIYIVTVRQPS